MIALLGWLNVTSVAFLAGAAAAAGAFCFERFADWRTHRSSLAVCSGLMILAVVNGGGYGWLRVRFAKQRSMPPPAQVVEARWNSHSFVIALYPKRNGPVLLGAGVRADTAARTRIAWAAIDGEEGPAITEWDGRSESLEWVEHDVTNAPYALRHGEVGVIGVGGGRDILSAIRSGSEHVTGIEINGTLLGLLRGSQRGFARIADHPGVALIHDELTLGPVPD